MKYFVVSDIHSFAKDLKWAKFGYSSFLENGPNVVIRLND